MGRREFAMHPIGKAVRRCIVQPLKWIFTVTIGSRRRFPFDSALATFKLAIVTAIKYTSRHPLLASLFVLFIFTCAYILYLALLPFIETFW